jgi:putative membrane-bound dehydrogenase-like protein
MDRRPLALGAFAVLAAAVLAIHAATAPSAEKLAAADASRGLPEGVKNTQRPEDVPLKPQEALKRITVPEGFRVTLFAGEPDVHQPIAMQFDDRGRLWVAECYAYPTWSDTGKDRLLIFEDRNHDGQIDLDNPDEQARDLRTVFWDQGNYLTGFALGYGGVWVCAAPNLLFIADNDRDGRPDGEPQVVLDGWSTKGVHNVLNSLAWGPDGWLYGCNGITAPSKVGKPGAPDSERVEMNCGIWRYHPTRNVFEVVAHGTTNPWGLDWNDHGEAFFTNCVIGHMFHLIPGAHYKRMFGQDYNPYVYDLINPCSDHLHWAGGDWTRSRGGKGEHDVLGGGHAHAGCMVYLGDNWPKKYRNTLFTANIHGNRVNNDLVERAGSGYVGRHGDDFLRANDEWFRGVAIAYGPDGGVYVTDWTEVGECHDKDGVHRASGRVYKIVHGEPASRPAADLSRLADAELVRLQLHANDWYVRHARRILAERAAAGNDFGETHALLRTMFESEPDAARKLRALWALYASQGATPEFLIGQLGHAEESVRVWAVRLLVDHGPPAAAAVTEFARLAESDASPPVRLALASALQRLPLADRWEIAERLAAREEDAADANLPLMIWYGVEPLVPADKTRAVGLAARTKIPLVRQFIARRTVDVK